jgi:hypothetical protein
MERGSPPLEPRRRKAAMAVVALIGFLLVRQILRR